MTDDLTDAEYVARLDSPDEDDPTYFMSKQLGEQDERIAYLEAELARLIGVVHEVIDQYQDDMADQGYSANLIDEWRNSTSEALDRLHPPKAQS